jgi:hypothetical protein
MRNIPVSALCIAVLCSAAMMAQAPARGFLYGVRVAEYVADPVYVPGPREPARYVFFQGDRIELALELFNRGANTYRFEVPSGGMLGLFALNVLAAPVKDIQPRITLGQYGIKSGGVLRSARVPTSILEVPANQGVELRGLLQTLTVPGLYEIQIVPIFKEAKVNTGVIRFEIRSVADRAARIEVARRRMWEVKGAGDCKRADVEAARLLDLHPAASEAFRLRAECAEESGRKEEAVAAYDRARELLLLGLDDLFLANAKPEHIQKIVDGLASQAATVGTRRSVD